jgi:hypothetical protein
MLNIDTESLQRFYGQLPEDAGEFEVELKTSYGTFRVIGWCSVDRYRPMLVDTHNGQSLWDHEADRNPEVEEVYSLDGETEYPQYVKRINEII